MHSRSQQLISGLWRQVIAERNRYGETMRHELGDAGPTIVSPGIAAG